MVVGVDSETGRKLEDGEKVRRSTPLQDGSLNVYSAKVRAICPWRALQRLHDESMGEPLGLRRATYPKEFVEIFYGIRAPL